MLNIFPEFLNYNLAAPVIIRLGLGLLLIGFSYREFTRDKEKLVAFFRYLHFTSTQSFAWLFAAIEILIGVLLIVGFGTQLIALIAMAIILVEWFKNYRANKLETKKLFWFYIVILLSCFSLLLTGAGFLALDLPL
jgi:uncharacterized membrane protein YphA (DoxX/SURF4 family)